jgi:hypothetical protein
MQILGLLGVYFDAVVVEVKKNLLLFRLGGSGHTVLRAALLFPTFYHNVYARLPFNYWRIFEVT